MNWWWRRKPSDPAPSQTHLNQRTHRYALTPKGVACKGCGCRSWQPEAIERCPNPGPQPKENT